VADRETVSREPKIIYLADRRAGFSDAAFADKWSAHGRLAMSLPIWRNMTRYAQCDPVAVGALSKPCDAIGLVWCRSLDAMASIAVEPELRQPLLLDDELRTFACHVREVAMLTVEETLLEGPRNGWKLFLFDSQDPPQLAVADSRGVRAVAVSRMLDSGYTAASRLPWRSVLECWFEDRESLERTIAAHATLLSSEGRMATGAYERPLYGYEPEAVRPA
jgi:hypothetical protein